MLVTFFIVALLSGPSLVQGRKEPVLKDKHPIHSLLEFKKHLSPQLTPQKAVQVFGPPEKDIGSGLIIYQYPVKEGGTLTLSFSSQLIKAVYTSAAGENEQLLVQSKKSELKEAAPENPNHAEKDLKFIEASLVKAGIIEDFQKMQASGLRIFIEGENESGFHVHIGSENPYKGGSGATYLVEKISGKVTLKSTETYEPVPEDLHKVK